MPKNLNFKMAQGLLPRGYRKKIALLVVVLGLLGFTEIADVIGNATGEQMTCSAPEITDGDTFVCNGTRIRLTGIDAPEMPGHCRPGRECTPGNPYKARDYLRELAQGPVTCRAIEKDSYGRTVAACEVNGKDLSCAMVAAGHAVKRYSPLLCL